MRALVLPAFLFAAAASAAARAPVLQGSEPSAQTVFDANLARAAAALEAGDATAARATLAEACTPLLALTAAETAAWCIDGLARAGRLATRAADLPLARAVFEKALASRLHGLAPDDLLIASARLDLATTSYAQGDVAGAKALYQLALQVLERALPQAHAEVRRARYGLATSLFVLRDLPAARASYEQILEIGSADDPVLQGARQGLAGTLYLLGDPGGARMWYERALSIGERTLGADAADLAAIRQGLMMALFDLGELVPARGQAEKALAALSKTLGATDPRILTLRFHLATIRKTLGDVAGARTLLEELVPAMAQVMAPDERMLLTARINLGATLHAQGENVAARTVFEDVLADWPGALEAVDDPELNALRGNLAVTVYTQGDFAAARVQFERVLAALEHTLPDEHPRVQWARSMLATVLLQQGDLGGACPLLESVLTVRRHTLPDDHPDLLSAMRNMAGYLQRTGDASGERGLLDAVLAAQERALDPTDLDLLGTRLQIAENLHRQGALGESAAIARSLLASLARTVDADHPLLAQARAVQLWTLARLGDEGGAVVLMESMLEAAWRRLRIAATASGREAQELLADLDPVLANVLSFAGRLGAPQLDMQVFELQESIRALAGAPTATVDPQLAPLAARFRAAASAVGEAVASGRFERSALDALIEERDAAERALRSIQGRTGATSRLDAGVIARALAPDARAIALRRHARFELDEQPERNQISERGLYLAAFVLAPGGALVRVELGSLERIAAAIERWRTAVGQPFEGRGLRAAMPEASDEQAAARELTGLLLEPLRSLLDGARTLHVCLDDAVHTVPLDALPVGDVLVGDRWSVHVMPSFAGLVGPSPSPPSEPSFLGVGGVAFGAADAAKQRGDAEPVWSPLPATAPEIEAIGQRFERTFGRAPALLVDTAATKAALQERVGAARFVHVATHGYFARGSANDPSDTGALGTALWSPLGVRAAVTGMAPMTLCGLVLAGVNRGHDLTGARPGILTAEELASFDLRSCELVVLSACETNVGITRAGQGIASLQAALHRAGARTTVTSLWRVDDERTRELFAKFYARLWEGGESAAKALWQAKLALRAKGYPTRDWAGWVLTGSGG